MIGRLRGLLVAKTTSHVLLDVGGIGYEVAVSPRALVELPAVGQEVVLHTHLHVREDQLALFGFADADQRDVFRILLGVSGVGPKVALAMLGTMTPDSCASGGRRGRGGAHCGSRDRETERPKDHARAAPQAGTAGCRHLRRWLVAR